jgi:hypothetical protein
MNILQRQSYNTYLNDIGNLAVTDGNFIVGNGTTWVAESGNTARTSLGLGTGDSPAFAGLTLTGLFTPQAGIDIQEESSDLASPSSGYRRLFARDSGGLVTLDSDGNRYEVEFAGGRVLQISLPTLIALTKAGALDDTDSDADGFIGIDKTNNRIYYRHSGGTWKYVASIVDQAEINLTSAANANGEAVRH